jgi:hypothetical protein
MGWPQLGLGGRALQYKRRGARILDKCRVSGLCEEDPRWVERLFESPAKRAAARFDPRLTFRTSNLRAVGPRPSSENRRDPRAGFPGHARVPLVQLEGRAGDVQ